MDKTKCGWIALNCIPGIGSVKAARLVERFGSPEIIFTQSEEVLGRLDFVGPDVAACLKQSDWQAMAAGQLEQSRMYGCDILTLADEAYPDWLRRIDYPPSVLYCRGGLNDRDCHALAVVGSRSPSLYGIQTTGYFVKGLVRRGYTIVSGLARGIDTQAHQAALSAGGRTIAVVAHGLDRIYPRENKQLMERIANCGAVLSEFPFGVPPLPNHFPRRNRIISGMAQGVLVVEARKKSGALITAQWAGEQGKEVFAVPGLCRAALSAGTHALIQDGAKLAASVEDILAELPPLPHALQPLLEHEPVEPDRIPLPAIHQKIRAALKSGVAHIDHLVDYCHYSVQQLLVELLALELQGCVKSIPGQVYQWVGK